MIDEDQPPALNEGHLHELLDRAHVFLCMIEDHLVSYDGLEEQYPEIHKLAEDASDALATFYQKVGAEMHDMEEAREKATDG